MTVCRSECKISNKFFLIFQSLPVLKPGSYQKLFPEAVPWSITHVPGVRVLQEHDHYRREALNMKNSLLYRMDSGMLPRYMGYVPGGAALI